jgi:hypothetical protein
MSYRVLIQTARVPHFTRCTPVFFSRTEAAHYAYHLRRRHAFIEAAKVEEAEGAPNAAWLFEARRFGWIRDPRWVRDPRWIREVSDDA